jgi:sulfite reductase alpha subunit-like flavoprotein
MAVPTYIDDRLAELGGERLQARGNGDASRADLFDEYDDWVDKLWVQLKETYATVIAEPNVQQEPRLQADIDSTRRQDVLRYEFLQSVRVVSNEVISKGDVQLKRHIVLQLPEEASKPCKNPSGGFRSFSVISFPFLLLQAIGLGITSVSCQQRPSLSSCARSGD